MKSVDRSTVVVPGQVLPDLPNGVKAAPTEGFTIPVKFYGDDDGGVVGWAMIDADHHAHIDFATPDVRTTPETATMLGDDLRYERRMISSRFNMLTGVVDSMVIVNLGGFPPKRFRVRP